MSVVASAINLIVARKLMAAGREHRSLVLETDGPRLMTDATVFTHREPCEDPASFADTELDRPAGDPAHPA